MAHLGQPLTSDSGPWDYQCVYNYPCIFLLKYKEHISFVRTQCLPLIELPQYQESI